jgi:glycosyltransferase involved in cell wall biosynthesis
MTVSSVLRPPETGLACSRGPEFSPKRILAFMKYGDRAASTRQRLLQYLPYLEKRNIHFDILALLDNDYVANISRKSSFVGSRTLRAYVRRAFELVRARGYDAIWVYGELFPSLPGAFERLADLHSVPLLYDYDDAMFHRYDRHRNPVVRVVLGKKLRPLMSRAAACLCGNKYLQAYAAQFCDRAEIVPTVVDTSEFTPPPVRRPSTQPVVIGWIGSPTTWSYVESYLPVIRRVCEAHGAVFKIIGAEEKLQNVPNVISVDWARDTEVAELQTIDVGIMPIPDEPWARGKCGYKLIQYMACGAAVVASPVGVNAEIVDRGINGFHATTLDEWESHLTTLVRDRDLRARFGLHARQKIVATYSLQEHAPVVERIIRRALESSKIPPKSESSAENRADRRGWHVT